MTTATEINIRFHADGYESAVAAIDVKHYSWPHDIDPLIDEIARIFGDTVEDVALVIDERAAELFWLDAGEMAKEIGYSGVIQQGRSGGWLVPILNGYGVSEGEMHEAPQARRDYAKLDAKIDTLLENVNETRRAIVREMREEATHFDGC